ncbi:hypothetical protein Y032_0015g2652 [Ancylostoma ceylanicum]|nr:hypothetical protein Y032_0015g2652 [Ancylostoma ceylanicum]
MDEQLHEQTQLTRLSPTKEETRCPENTFMVTYRVCGKNCCAVTTVAFFLTFGVSCAVVLALIGLAIHFCVVLKRKRKRSVRSNPSQPSSNNKKT